jgi:hypothetical protein
VASIWLNGTAKETLNGLLDAEAAQRTCKGLATTTCGFKGAAMAAVFVVASASRRRILDRVIERE